MVTGFQSILGLVLHHKTVSNTASNSLRYANLKVLANSERRRIVFFKWRTIVICSWAILCLLVHLNSVFQIYVRTKAPAICWWKKMLLICFNCFLAHSSSPWNQKVQWKYVDVEWICVYIQNMRTVINLQTGYYSAHLCWVCEKNLCMFTDYHSWAIDSFFYIYPIYDSPIVWVWYRISDSPIVFLTCQSDIR